MIEAIEDSIRELGEKPIRREGEDEAGWWLLDYVDVVVHVFGEEERAYYDLERLWRDAPRLDWQEPDAGLLRVDSDPRGPIAQLVERLAGSQEVRGSNPRGSTTAGQQLFTPPTRMSTPLPPASAAPFDAPPRPPAEGQAGRGDDAWRRISPSIHSSISGASFSLLVRG